MSGSPPFVSLRAVSLSVQFATNWPTRMVICTTTSVIAHADLRHYTGLISYLRSVWPAKAPTI